MRGLLPRLGSTALLALVSLSLGAPPAAHGWTAETFRTIAGEAARLAPPDLYRQLDRHRTTFERSASIPESLLEPEQWYRNADGGGSLDRAIEEAVENAIRAIELHRPFDEIVDRMGLVVRLAAEANNPLRTSDADRWEHNYFADYADYVASARDRLPVIFYGLDDDLERGDLPGFVADVLGRGRALYPAIGNEYRRIGRLPGRQFFDDRSTAFGLSSVAYSRAISDAALLLRFVWIQAGGADPRPTPREAEGRLLVVRQAPDPGSPSPFAGAFGLRRQD